MKKMFQGAALFTMLALLNLQVITAHGQGTAFTYQGRLNSGGTAAGGLYDFRFKLYFDAQGNTQAGTAYATNAITVTNGLFMTTIDFGAGIFNGGNYWLEVDVRTNGAESYTVLSPLQAVTPTPYAVFAETANSASNVLGAVSASQLSGTLAATQLPASVVTNNASGLSLSGTFTGNGANVTNVNAATLNGLNAGNFWQLGGNNVASGQIIGSTNNQPVEMWVNNTRALRLEPTTNDASHAGLVNVIGGSPANRIAPGTYGSVIAGGGSSNYTIYGPGAGNTLASDLSFIGGGEWNAIQTNAIFSLLGGGNENTIQSGSTFSVLAGGYENVLTNSSYAFLGAGLQNQINNSTEGFIGGGANNFIQGSTYAVIAGGGGNSIYNNGPGASVLGGYVNIIQANSAQATIAGGGNNTIQFGSYNAAISGGWNNTIGTNCSFGFVGGGGNNKLLYTSSGSQSAPYSVLVGGQYNVNGGNASFIGAGFGNSISNIVTDSFLGGGSQNSLWPYASYDFLGGGANNVINSQVTYSFLGGGQGNQIQGSYTTLDSFLGAGLGNSLAAAQAVLGGGVSNSIATGAVGAVLAGGLTNAIGTNAVGAFVGGGMNNTATTNYAVVAGGANNTAAGLYSLAAGQNARALFAGDFVWADSQTTNFTASANDQFLIRARGGVGINLTNPASALDVNGNVNASTFSGNGSGLTGLTAGNLTGTVPAGVLPASVVTNGQSFVQFNDLLVGGSLFVLQGILSLPSTAEILAGGIPIVSVDTNANAYFGTDAGYENGGQSGSYNTGLGSGALQGNFGGSENVAVGCNALATLNSTGYGALGNTAVGASSLANLQSGSANIAVGPQAGVNLNGAEADNIYIGNGGVAGENNTIRIGTPGIQTNTILVGTVSVPVLAITGGSDLAEPFNVDAPGETQAGAVVVIDDAHPGRLKLSNQAYDTRVAGVISGARGVHPGIQMRQEGLLDGGRNVALSGRVYVQADASNGAIKPGDLLTTSALPGFAMKATDHRKAVGAILGKAMTGLTDGHGFVLVLVTLQ